LTGVGEVTEELVHHLRDACGTKSAAVYVDDGHTLRLRSTAGDIAFAPDLSHAPATVSWAASVLGVAPVPSGLLSSLAVPSPATALGAPIRWRTTLLGLIVLGPSTTGRAYSADDLDFLAAVAAQVAAAVVANRPSETDPGSVETDRANRCAIAHDLKNCVAALSILVRNASNNFGDPDFQRDTVTTLSSTVERMRRLLVKLSSPDEGAVPAAPEPIDLQALIIEATTPLVTDAKVQLVRNLRPVTMVYGNRDALLRVVENLMTNAAEAIEREGTVTVTLAEEHGYAVISVADTGRGMPEDYQQHHLFAPFRSTKKGGWGVGLYQAKRVIEDQSGEICVESVEGHGTTFTVKLPLRADFESPSLESVR
jgi:putative PEP-CTERM system histidine kinase